MYDSNFAKFYMKNNHERTDKTEVETTTTEKKSFQISIVQPTPPPANVVEGEEVEATHHFLTASDEKNKI